MDLIAKGLVALVVKLSVLIITGIGLAIGFKLGYLIIEKVQVKCKKASPVIAAA